MCNMLSTLILVLCMPSILPHHNYNMLPSCSLSFLPCKFINIGLATMSEWVGTKSDPHIIGYFILQCLILQSIPLFFLKGSVAIMIYHKVSTVTSERQCSLCLLPCIKTRLLGHASKMIFSTWETPGTQHPALSTLSLLLHFSLKEQPNFYNFNYHLNKGSSKIWVTNVAFPPTFSCFQYPSGVLLIIINEGIKN